MGNTLRWRSRRSYLKDVGPYDRVHNRERSLLCTLWYDCHTMCAGRAKRLAESGYEQNAIVNKASSCRRGRRLFSVCDLRAKSASESPTCSDVQSACCASGVHVISFIQWYTGTRYLKVFLSYLGRHSYPESRIGNMDLPSIDNHKLFRY